MAIREYEKVTRLSRYLDITREIRDHWPEKEKPERRGEEQRLWFRGQRRWDWRLSPRLYREPYKGADENEIRLEFQSQGVQLIAGRLPTGKAEKWDWYFLMQHHGVPTRLLDWTENPLVGLFFAVEAENDDGDSAVWVLDPWWLNEKLRLGITGPMLPDYSESHSYLPELEDAFFGKKVRRSLPAAIEPPHVDRRVAAQQSRFLVFGTTQDLTKSKPVKGRGARLARIRIPQSARRSLKFELDDCGVNFASVYPDLEGLALHILFRWKRAP